MPFNEATQRMEWEGPEPYEKCFGHQTAGHIDDNGDGHVFVTPGDGWEYKVTYQYGSPYRCEKFGPDGPAQFWEYLKSE